MESLGFQIPVVVSRSGEQPQQYPHRSSWASYTSRARHRVIDDEGKRPMPGVPLPSTEQFESTNPTETHPFYLILYCQETKPVVTPYRRVTSHQWAQRSLCAGHRKPAQRCSCWANSTSYIHYSIGSAMHPHSHWEYEGVPTPLTPFGLAPSSCRSFEISPSRFATRFIPTSISAGIPGTTRHLEEPRFISGVKRSQTTLCPINQPFVY